MKGAKGVAMRVLVGRQDGAPNFAMREFQVEPGGQTPHHQHNYEHQVLILQGQGQVKDGDAAIARPITAGDVLYIPANELHQFVNTSDELLKFVCLVPSKFDCGDGSCQPTPGT